MKKRTFAVLWFLSVILYLFLFPFQMKKEMIMVPQWNVSVSEATSGDLDSQDIYPFTATDGSGANILGYVSSDGNIIHREPVYYRAAVHPRGYINYSSAGGALVIQNPAGEILGRYETGGFPVLKDDWFLVVSRDRKGISRWDWNGSLLWEYHFGAIITSMDLKPFGVLLGFLNGDTVFVSPQGKIVFTEPIRGEAVYGCALAGDGSLFAVISGINPQNLKLFSYSEDAVQLLWETSLEEAYRTNRNLFFSEDNRILYLEDPLGIVQLDSAGRQQKHLDFRGTLGGYFTPGSDDLGFFWSRSAGSRELIVEDPHGNRRDRISLPDDGTIIFMDERFFLVSGDGQIFRVDREMY